MDRDELALSSSSAAADKHKESSVRGEINFPEGTKPSEVVWSDAVCPEGDRSLSEDQHVTESMSITSADQEKLLLLNKNTELRRVNKELMKLNEEWDQMYRSTTLRLQHRLESLEQENTTLKDLNSKLLLKVENQQNAKAYYEQALMLELKKNKELQEYIRLQEGRMHQQPIQKATNLDPSSPSLPSSYGPPASSRLDVLLLGKHPNCGPQQEVQDLKEQLEALRCQIEIYAAEYQMEHNNHKYTLQDNRRLRRKREEMRQQVELLREQLKVYEDDFRRERSDKQMLQRLLLKKTPPDREPALVQRCNNEWQPQEGDKWTQTGARVHPQVEQHHPLCPKHSK
ncbi:uncharacterized protein si:ch211-153b23.7 isoform X2 [Dunckerocampus dactyliophorus]|uniref:uncharacterized protein si:ch211-153b23.7 isoform X2 n=1 Tax=Dunckerocampus dactyliophorus TaxID=161453 RepID=UPI002404F000|nr:uncharacterized protein si:ch211-153b23.7 isoform X2 [Dunckerocampus dactyliophorus]